MDEALLREHLGDVGELTVFETTGSTNDEARAAATRGAAHGAAFVADHQTAGRGRGAHRWHSPAGENVYASVILRPSRPAAALSALTLAVGVGVAELVDRHLPGERARIKWPNDIYVDDKKLSGILTEATLQGNRPPVIVVGVGINVQTRSFPPELADTATSIASLTASPPSCEQVAAELITAIVATAEAFEEAGLAPFLPRLRERSFLTGREVQVGEIRGVVTGIDDVGRLLVGDQPVASGEITLL